MRRWLRTFLHELGLRVVELCVCSLRGHRYKFDAVGIARCRRCKREAIEGFGTLPRSFVAVLLLLILSGCAQVGELRALEDPTERAWLAVHAIDATQTYRIAQDLDCYAERDWLTSELIGNRPERGEVVAWAVGMAALHVGVTELLLRNDHPKLARAWQWVTLGNTAYSVGHNHSIGIRIGSPNRPRWPCLSEREPAPVEPSPAWRAGR